MHTSNKVLAAALTVAMALIGLITSAAPANAQTYSYGNSGVANVSFASGRVVIVRGDSGSQIAASLNAPLMPGDYIATGSGSHAEVQFDGISMLRLAGNTQVRLVNLRPGSREMQLAVGTVELAELQGADGTPQIDTPAVTVRPNQTGDYRVTVSGNGESFVTVRSGAATIVTANGSQTLTPGSTLIANGSSISLQNAVGFDSFDQFNSARDQAMVAAYNANPYVSPQLAGYSNFANYGQWQNVPGYGYAWAPNNQSETDFAPYQNGQWAWEPGYGYTWVDNAPYGYATSHYGSWFNNPSYGGWLWQPPAYQYQNSSGLASAWLPAVVSFFLSGNNGNSLGGLGNIVGNLSGFLGNSSNADIGWIPLAPGEPYQPWYGQNYSYPSTGLTNVTNVTNIYNTYSNARYYRGITMVPVASWRNGNFRRLVVPRPQQVRRIVLIRGALPIVPTTANLHYSSSARVTRPIALSRTFAAPRLAAKAPAVARLSFKAQQARIRTLAAVRPKIIPLPRNRVSAAHRVYHPIAHAQVHLNAIKPVAHVTTAVRKSATHRAPRPAAERRVVTHRAPPPVVIRPAVVHRAPPPTVVRPAVTHRAPPPVVERPVVVHHASPPAVVRPTVTHHTPPAVIPIGHAPAADRPATPAHPRPVRSPAAG